MSKIILVTGDLKMTPPPGYRWPLFFMNLNYGNAISAAGGLPIMMTNYEKAEEYADMADGLLITGGESVHPSYYNETFEHMADNIPEEIEAMKAGGNPERDVMEMAIFKAFKARKKPVMGICRGHQLIGAACGSQLTLNFPRKQGYEHHLGISHKIKADADSILGRLYGTEFLANSYHQNSIVAVSDELRVTAYSDDGVIEGIEHKTLPIFGVQFHPERMRGDNPIPAFGPDGTDIFKYFLSLC